MRFLTLKKVFFVLAGSLSVIILAYIIIFNIIYAPVNLEDFLYKTLVWDINFSIIDMNHDGNDEVILHSLFSNPPHLVLLDSELNSVDQENFFGINRIQGFSHADIDNDNIDEIAAAYLFRDSVRIDILNCLAQGFTPARSFIFPKGEDVRGMGYWDGSYKIVGMLDVNNDKIKDAIIHVNTGFNFYPRAVFAYDINNDSTLWRYDCGTMVENVQVDDFNGDGEMEILMGSTAVSNKPDTIINNTDDGHSYAIMLNKYGHCIWQKEFGGTYSQTSVVGFPYCGDNELNIFILANKRSSEDTVKRPTNNKIIGINGRLGILMEEYNLGNGNYYFDPAMISNVEFYDKYGVVLQAGDGRIMMFDKSLELLYKSPVYDSPRIDEIDDINKDGRTEIIINTGSGECIILDDKLQEVAYYYSKSNQRIKIGYMNQPSIDKSKILIYSNSVMAFSIPELRPWIVSDIRNMYSYKSSFVLIIALLIIVLITYIKEKSYLTEISIIAGELSLPVNHGLIGIEKNIRLAYANRNAQQILQLPDNWKFARLTDVFSEEEGIKLEDHLFKISKNNVSTDNAAVSIQRFGKLNLLLFKKMAPSPGHLKRSDLSFFSVTDSFRKSKEEILDSWYHLSHCIAHNAKRPIINAKDRIDLARQHINGINNVELGFLVGQLDESLIYLSDTTRMIDRFLNLRIVETDFVPANLAELLQRSLDETLYPIQKSISGRINMENPEIKIMTNEELFNELIKILIQNAADAVDSKGGEISITADSAYDLQSKDPRIKDIEIVIKDNGHGIEKSDLSEIFEPGYTTKSSGMGTGLGLAIARWICEVLNANMTFESEVKKGTTVTLLFRQAAK